VTKLGRPVLLADRAYPIEVMPGMLADGALRGSYRGLAGLRSYRRRRAGMTQRRRPEWAGVMV